MALTELTARKLRPPKTGRRREKYDGVIPGFGIRITDLGARSYILVYTHHGRRRRYTLGRVGELSLDEAREKARELRGQVRAGRDPAAEQKMARGLAKIATAKSFGEVLDLYERRALAGQRRGREVRMSVDKHLLPAWRDLPIASITRAHVIERIEALVDAGTPAAARRLFEVTRRLFSWAIARGAFGIEHSPCDKLRPRDFGQASLRTRILTDAEWRALARAVPRLGYPFGPAIELLMLTALRRSEVAKARWSEIDLGKQLWTIPAQRMKGGRVHTVPLIPQVIAILNSLPRTSEFLFPIARGNTSISGFSATKKRRLDPLMLEELRAEDPGAKLERWTLHDVRRSIRTQLSMLPVPGGDLVRELILAHAKPGLHQVYDQYAYLDERRRALELWQEKLTAILENRSADVVALAQRA